MSSVFYPGNRVVRVFGRDFFLASLAVLLFQGASQAVLLVLPFIILKESLADVVLYVNIINIATVVICLGFNSLLVRDVASAETTMSATGVLNLYLKYPVFFGGFIVVATFFLVVAGFLRYELLIVIIIAFLGAISRIFYSFYNGLQRYAYLVKLSAVYFILSMFSFVFIYAFAVVGWLWSRLVVEFVFFFLALLYTKKYFLGGGFSCASNNTSQKAPFLNRRFLSEAANVFVGLLGNRVVLSIEFFLLSFATGGSGDELEVFGLISLYMNVFMAFAGVFSVYLLPRLASGFSGNGRVVLLGFLANGVITIMIILMLQIVGKWMGYPLFDQAKSFLIVPFLFSVLYFVEVCLGTVSIAKGMTRIPVTSNVVSIGVSLSVFIILFQMSDYGLMSASIMLISTAVVRLLVYLFSLKGELWGW